MALSFTPDGNINWNGHIGKLALSSKAEHIHITGPTYTHTPQKCIALRTKRHIYVNVHSGIIHNSQKLETIRMPLTSNCGMFIQQNKIQLLLHAQYG